VVSQREVLTIWIVAVTRLVDYWSGESNDEACVSVSP
jgi:hypothetical protein